VAKKLQLFLLTLTVTVGGTSSLLLRLLAQIVVGIHTKRHTLHIELLQRHVVVLL
jgi:hypothetical protein